VKRRVRDGGHSDIEAEGLGWSLARLHDGWKKKNVKKVNTVNSKRIQSLTGF